MTHVNPHDTSFSTYIVEIGPDKFAAYRGSYMLAKGSLDHVRKTIRSERAPLPPLPDSEMYPGRKIRPHYRRASYRIEYLDDDGKRCAELVDRDGNCLGILKPSDFPAGPYAAFHTLDAANAEATILLPQEIDVAPADLIGEVLGDDTLYEGIEMIDIDSYERMIR